MSRTLSDMLCSIKDSIGLHASRGAILGEVFEKLKINKVIGLKLIKTIMTINDNNDDNEWLYSLINDNVRNHKQYNDIFFNDIMTNLNTIIIHSPKSQWWKSFGLRSIEMINFINHDDVKIKITEIVALAGNDGVIVTEFSKLLNLPVQSYHYFIDNLVAQDILTKRMIIPINKKDPSVVVPKGQGIRAMVNIVHLKRFANTYNPMTHYACIEYDSQTKLMLVDVIQSALPPGNPRSGLSVKTLSKVLNLTRSEAKDVKYVVSSPDDDDDDLKVDDTLPFKSYLKYHTLYDQVRMLVIGTPGGICTDSLRTVLKIELKKAANIIQKFKNEFKYPSQERLHNYNYSTFLLATAAPDTGKEKEDTYPPEYKDLGPHQIRHKLVMDIMTTPGRGIEVAREMNEKVQAEIIKIGLPFKMDRKMVQKTCQHLHDEKKVVLLDMRLPEGVLLFKLPEIKIVALPGEFNDVQKVNEFMIQTIDRLKPGAQKKPKPEAAPRVRQPVAEKSRKRRAKTSKVKKEESSSSDSESIADSIASDDMNDNNSEDIFNYDNKLERVLQQTATKRRREALGSDDDSDVDDVQAKKLKKLAKSMGMEESDEENIAQVNDVNDDWTPLQEAYSLQYHLLNCLHRILPKKTGANNLFPWTSIILRNLDTLDLSYIFGKSFTKEQMAKIGKKWAIIKSYLLKALKTYNTIRKILTFVMKYINPLDRELAELLNGILDPSVFEERRRMSVTNLERVAMTKALRVCADECNGSLDVLDEYSTSSAIKHRVESELLSAHLIQCRAASVLPANDTSAAPVETTYELCEDKILSAERASFHYYLSKLGAEEKKAIGQNVINITSVLNPNTACVGELQLMEVDQTPFPVKLYDESCYPFDETNALSVSGTIENKGHYHEHLNRISVSLKVTESRDENIIPLTPQLTTATTMMEVSEVELNRHYDWLIQLVQGAGSNGVNSANVIKLLSDELKTDIDTETLNAIINKGIQEKLIFQIYDFILDDPTQTNKQSLLVDQQYEKLYRVNDREDGTCPWINSDGILNSNFFLKLKANLKALLTSSPGANFTLLHSYFPYLTGYQMEILLKTFIADNFIVQRTPTASFRIDNPFDKTTYPSKPCYFLST